MHTAPNPCIVLRVGPLGANGTEENRNDRRYADPADLARRTISRIDEAIPAAAAPAEPIKAQMIAAARAKSAARRFDSLVGR